MSNYKALLLKADSSISTFNETTHRWDYVGTSDLLNNELFASKGFAYENIKKAYTDMLLKYTLVDTLEDGSEIYESEEVKKSYGVTGLEDTTANDTDYVKATIPSFTPYDYITANDRVLLYSTEASLKPTVSEIKYSSYAANKHEIDKENGIKVTVKALYNYSGKIKMRLKINDGSYGNWSDLNFPYENFNLVITSSMLTIGDNKVSIQISNEDGSAVTDYQATDTINLKNSAPYLSLISTDSNSFKIHFIINDEDTDTVKYRILLNNSLNKDLVLKDWSQNAESPVECVFYIDSNNVVVGETNNLVIEYQDEMGVTGTYKYSFEGKYRNILFMNENGDILTTDKGIVLRYLDFNKIVAGNVTPIRKIIVQNSCDRDITNLILRLENTSKLEGVDVYLSKTKLPFVNNNELTFGSDVIKVGEEREFYVRIETSADSQGKCAFKIYADADIHQ